MTATTAPTTTTLRIPLGDEAAQIMVTASAPVASTFAFLWQMYAPGFARAAVTPQEVHDLVFLGFTKLETIVRGGALNVPINTGIAADVLKAVVGKSSEFETWLLKETDPWVKEELQFYGILPKAA